MGLGITSWLWGGMLGNPLAGAIYDHTGSYAGAVQADVHERPGS